MSITPPWRPGTQAAARREEAVRLILAGQPMAKLRTQLRLDTFDARCIAAHLRNLADAEPYEPPTWKPGPIRKALHREFGEAPLPPPVAEALAASRACVGLHPLPEHPDHEKVTWSPYTNRMARIRVIDATCEGCGGDFEYELCAAGGLMFIRRTNWIGAPPEVTVTEYLPAPRINDLWRRLLTGQAR